MDDFAQVLAASNGEIAEVEGILTSLTEGVTKNGDPFVSGNLWSKEGTLPFKLWNTELARWEEESGAANGKPVVLRGAISINPRNDEVQLTLREVEGQPSLTILPDSEVARLEPQPVVPLDKMLGLIKGVVGEVVAQAGLKEACENIISNIEAEPFYPYNQEIHPEKYGFIVHLYNCFCKLYNMKGDPKDSDLTPEVDKGVVATSILAYHLGYYQMVKPDEVTGELKYLPLLATVCGSEEQAEAMFLGHTFQLVLRNNAGKECYNTMNCVLAILGLAEPITLEAVTARSIVREELEQALVSERLRGLSEWGQRTALVSGEVRTFIKL